VVKYTTRERTWKTSTYDAKKTGVRSAEQALSVRLYWILGTNNTEGVCFPSDVGKSGVRDSSMSSLLELPSR